MSVKVLSRIKSLEKRAEEYAAEKYNREPDEISKMFIRAGVITAMDLKRFYGEIVGHSEPLVNLIYIK
ncbi:MAG: hypothetical protein C0392_15945 [Syntrophus sp. (in: bacteria)]|nr:hypothetical protein [Syntrophus sp. (in: bacteria)]